jgi:hypothetical protein
MDDADNKTILGFYSLSPASVEYARTPEIVRRGWLAMPCRVSGWRVWPWIASYRGRDLADSFCSRREDAACWHRQKLAVSYLSSTPKMKEWQDGMQAMVLYRCWMRRYLCCCRSRQSRLR